MRQDTIRFWVGQMKMAKSAKILPKTTHNLADDLADLGAAAVFDRGPPTPPGVACAAGAERNRLPGGSGVGGVAGNAGVVASGVKQRGPGHLGKDGRGTTVLC